MTGHCSKTRRIGGEGCSSAVDHYHAHFSVNLLTMPPLREHDHKSDREKLSEVASYSDDPLDKVLGQGVRLRYHQSS
jgi:hypothetical protein